MWQHNGTGFTRPAGLQRNALFDAPYNNDAASEFEPHLARSGANAGYAALSQNLVLHWSPMALLALYFFPLGFTEARHHPLSHLCWGAATFSHF